jgi:NlpC/P60 family
MLGPAKSLLLLSVLGVAVAPCALGQEDRASSNAAHRVARETPDRVQKPIAPRSLNQSDGLAILGAALDFRHHSAEYSSDCSHLVHGIYERAGFPYEYASSSDLYDGADEFRRVANPQPGDLAVWRGHVGIVVNPAQHSFFSALGSGDGVDAYDSAYWKQRGRPRFFRYVKAAPSGVLSASSRTASLKPAALGNARAHTAVAEDVAPDRSNDSSEDSSDEPSRQTESSARLAANFPATAARPRVAAVNSVRPKPDQVSAAFLAACTEWEESVGGRDLFHSAHSVIVFDRFEVKKVHISGSEGWAEVQIEEPVSLTGSKTELHKHSEKQRWPLFRRSNTSWDLTPSQDTIYLPQSTAARVLAHELAQITADSPDAASRTQEKAELARLLNALLGK